MTSYVPQRNPLIVAASRSLIISCCRGNREGLESAVIENYNVTSFPQILWEGIYSRAHSPVGRLGNITICNITNISLRC